jgi:hypothetical protein
MATSYNGWPASRDPSTINIRPFEVAGRSFPGGVKGGAVHWVLKYVAAQMHLRVESLYTGTDRDDWGYSYRSNVNNPSELSCHSSGTAIDVNATEHPNGVRNTFTYAQVQTIRKILREVGGVVYWGGDFTTRDEMHFEIRGSSTAVAAVSKRLVTPPWWHRDIVVGTAGDDVKVAQRRLGRTVTGKFNTGDRDALKRLEGRLHLTQTGKLSKSRAFFVGTSA